ncbi:hypothetical protein L596_022819 [Steinernema carpocapsae]|uniref:NR LBD domain-containing protein n=1 Tax=Steinernema carpocapsae TaxID=34508 RepID=A0A4U5MMW5_STECR|nr:hypothetical protein L596_022819 [Steinernema carpocapsae]
MTESVRRAYMFRIPIDKDLRTHRGTSEPMERYWHFGHQRNALYHETKVFHDMLRTAPILQDLDYSTRESMFENCVMLYNVFIYALSNSRQARSGRFYASPNAYIDMDYNKALHCLAYTPSNHSLATGPHDLNRLSIFSAFSTKSRQKRNFSKKMCTDEDIALMILLIIILSNDCDKANSAWQRPIHDLKRIKEAEYYLTRKGRKNVFMADLLLHVSDMRTQASELSNLYGSLNLILGGGCDGLRVKGQGVPESHS